MLLLIQNSLPTTAIAFKNQQSPQSLAFSGSLYTRKTVPFNSKKCQLRGHDQPRQVLTTPPKDISKVQSTGIKDF
jgi:hypothetical protein